MPETTRESALAVLRLLVGNPDADFHDGQFEAIETLVDDHRRALVVQRTGWGKSAVYFVATMLLRQRGAGPTVLVSPLLALMRDQVAAAERAGVRPCAINSTNAARVGRVLERAGRRRGRRAAASRPERLNNPAFRENQLPALVAARSACWSSTRRTASATGATTSAPTTGACATSSRRCRRACRCWRRRRRPTAAWCADVAEQLGTGDAEEVLTIRGPLARASLRLGVLRLPDRRGRGWRGCSATWGTCRAPASSTRSRWPAAEDTARLLREAGHDVRAYTGQTDPAEREELEAALKANRVKALVATSALGMGFDKPDLGFVLHLGAPSSPVRTTSRSAAPAARPPSADVLLLPGPEDRDIWQYFATASMPDEDRAQRVIAELSERPPLSTPALEARVDVRRTPLELLLKVLDVDGAVRRVQGGWVATGQPWTYDAERYARIAAARQAEQEHMLEYERTDGCRMEFLQRSLDDDTATPCGRCDSCAGPWYPTDVAADAADAAERSLDRVGVADRAAGAVAGRRGPAGVPVRGKHPRGGAGGRGPGARAAHRPGLGDRPARRVRGRGARRAGHPGHARGLRAGAGRVGLGRAAGGGRRAAVPAASAARRLPRARARGDRPAALCGRPGAAGRRPDRTSRAATARSVSRASGTVRRLRRWTLPGAGRCCSSTTWSTAAGP